MVTGEVGTGKTLLLRCLLRLLQRARILHTHISSTAGSLLRNSCSTLSPTSGCPPLARTKASCCWSWVIFWSREDRRKLTTVLILDEAHHLSAEILEEVRLLTNLETAEDKLLQIVLVGQPELEEKLDSVGLRQLKQRIALRARLEPLDWDETKGYIERRLQIAGTEPAGRPVVP